MTLPVITHTTDPFPASSAAAAVLVIPDPDGAADALSDFDGLAQTLAAIGYKGSASAFSRVHLPSFTSLPLAVVSAGAKPTAQSVRDAVATAVRTLTGFTDISI